MSENPYGPDCDERDKPDDERACHARERCNGYWFSGPWKQVQHNLSYKNHSKITCAVMKTILINFI